VLYKRAEPIVMPFGELTLVGPRNHLLDRVEILHGKEQFGGCPAHWESAAVYAATG